MDNINNNTPTQDEKVKNSSILSDIQIKFSLCPRKDSGNDRKQYKILKHTDQEKDHRITEYYTRLYRIPFESHAQGCTKEHILLNKDKLDEIINSIISSDFLKKIQESILLHSNLYELIIPEFKCHGLGFYYKPESDQEIFIKNLEPCYYETCPMYAKHLDSSPCNINYLESWNNTNDDEKQIFAKIASCAEKVFELMYPNYKEINENMKQNNLDYKISIEFNQRNIKLFNNDEKDKSIFNNNNDNRREMNLRSIHRCSKLLDNLSDGSINKEKNEIQNSNLELHLMLKPNTQGSWKKVGKRFVVTFILSLFFVIATSLGCYFMGI